MAGLCAARGLSLAAALALAGCAPIPPPDVLGALDEIRAAPAVVAARELVPSAVQRADLLRLEANQAFDAGDFAGAQIVGERARAAYALAVAVARVARAEQDLALATADARASDEQLGAADAEQQRLAAEIAALELELATVGRPTGPEAGAPTTTAAERAAATRSVELQARLLCMAARLLEPSIPAASGVPAPGDEGPAPPGPQSLAELEARLADRAPATATLPEAFELRQACLGELQALRRRLARGAASPRADELLVTLSELDVGDVGRDDRGVTVTIYAAFDRGRLTSSAAGKLASLGELARRHPAFPLLVVIHEREGVSPSSAAEGAGDSRPAAALARALGVEAAVTIAGDAQPSLPAHGRHAGRNERVEIVFVSPSLL